MANLKYLAVRVGLIVIAGGVLYLAGMRGFLLAGVAVLVGALVSYVAFASLRDAAAAELAQRRARRPAREPAIDEDAAHEDALLEAPENAEAGAEAEPERGTDSEYGR